MNAVFLAARLLMQLGVIAIGITLFMPEIAIKHPWLAGAGFLATMTLAYFVGKKERRISAEKYAASIRYLNGEPRQKKAASREPKH